MFIRIILRALPPILMAGSVLGQQGGAIASWGQSGDAFAYRGFANRKVQIEGMPVVFDQAVSYFKSRGLEYTVKGENAVRGQIWGVDESGNLRFEGNYLRNSLTGSAKTIHTNGRTRDSGMLVQNLPDGEWLFYRADGTLRAKRVYNAFMWWGLQWSIQLNNPFWNRFYLTELYQRSPAAFYKMVIADETFDNRYSPPFYYCLQHGKSVGYYPNGSIADSGYFYQGLPEGLWVAYYENGVVKEMGAYKLGEKSGRWKLQYPSGKLKSLKEYRQGRVVQSKEFGE